MVRRQRRAPDGNVFTDEVKVTTRENPFLAHEDKNFDTVILTTPKNFDVLEKKLHLFSNGTLILIRPLPVSNSTLFMHC